MKSLGDLNSLRDYSKREWKLFELFLRKFLATMLFLSYPKELTLRSLFAISDLGLDTFWVTFEGDFIDAASIVELTDAEGLSIWEAVRGSTLKDSLWRVLFDCFYREGCLIWLRINLGPDIRRLGYFWNILLTSAVGCAYDVWGVHNRVSLALIALDDFRALFSYFGALIMDYMFYCTFINYFKLDNFIYFSQNVHFTFTSSVWIEILKHSDFLSLRKDLIGSVLMFSHNGCSMMIEFWMIPVMLLFFL